MAERLVETPAPFPNDRLGRPLIGPCMIWTNAAIDRKGYGVLGNKEFGSKVIQRAHRVGYALAHGIPLTELRGIPELDHLCRVTTCCAAAHLEPVTHAENIARGNWHNGNADKTRCKNGHEFTEENTYYNPDGRRNCRACQRDRSRRAYDPTERSARYQRKRQRQAAAQAA